MEKKKQVNTKKKKSLLWILLGGIVSISLIICSIIGASVVLPLGVLPTTWITLIILGVIIVVLITFILSLAKVPIALRIIQYIVVIGLSGLMIFASQTVHVADQAMEEVIKQPTSFNQYISIIALRDSNIYSLNDIGKGKIGIQSSVDTDSMNQGLEYIKNKVEGKVTTSSYVDYTKAIDALYKGEIQAMIMSENYRELIEENYEDFKAKTAIIDAVEIEVPLVDIVKKIDITSNSFTILVSGIDTLTKGKPTANYNSDVNMLITVNPLTHSIIMTSIPRDSYVPNACMANQYDKLTHTGYHGLDCTIKTIENTFDIEVNYYAKISFSSIINLVNALGGIEVDVPMSFCERKANRVDIIYLKKGKQVLNGEQALALARNRHNVKGGDLGRGKNQQLVVNAIIKKVLTPDVLANIDDVITKTLESVSTNFTKKEIYSFVNMVADSIATPWTISNNIIAGTTGWGECASIPGMELSIVELSEEEIKKVKYIVEEIAIEADLSQLAFSINDMEVQDTNDIELEGETEGADGYDFCWLTQKKEENKETTPEPTPEITSPNENNETTSEETHSTSTEENSDYDINSNLSIEEIEAINSQKEQEGNE